MKMKRTTSAQLAILMTAVTLAGSAYGADQQDTKASAQVGDTSAMAFVSVPGGCYLMGSEKGEKHENPVHKVCLNGFEIGKFEVTQGQWKAAMGSNPSNFQACGDDCPVEQVSWNDAQSFIEKLNLKSSRKHRLPSEAEWEYACRSGGKDGQYAGSDVDNIAWGQENSDKTTHPTGTKAPNDLGIHDMNGNVWEWVQDAFTTPYSLEVTQNNPVINQGENRVLRGGSWNAKVNYVRCSIRNRTPPDRRHIGIGFRVLRELEAK
jgi:formylglycine-generating enzyme required for sulfatase activity